MNQLANFDSDFNQALKWGGYAVYNIPSAGTLPVRCSYASDSERAWQIILGSCNPYVIVDQETKSIALLFDKIVGELTERAVYTALVITRRYICKWGNKPEVVQANRKHCVYIICDGEDGPCSSEDVKNCVKSVREIIL
jgi:hypothetical protein